MTKHGEIGLEFTKFIMVAYESILIHLPVSTVLLPKTTLFMPRESLKSLTTSVYAPTETIKLKVHIKLL